MNKLANRVKEKMKLLIDYLLRREYLKMALGETSIKVGKIVEDEDKIVIYAKQKLVDRYCKDVICNVKLDGFDPDYKSALEIGEKYKTIKPVYYIFDGIKFDCLVVVTSNFSTITFRNCEFYDGLSVLQCKHLVLENNRYCNWLNSFYFGLSKLFGKFGELTIKNDNLCNNKENEEFADTLFDVDIIANKVNVVNSIIRADNMGSIHIVARDMNITDSQITGYNIEIDSDSISSKNSLLKADCGVVINNDNYDFNGDVESPILYYNGIDTCELDMIEENNLKDARLELLQELRYIRDNCDNSTSESIGNYGKVL